MFFNEIVRDNGDVLIRGLTEKMLEMELSFLPRMTQQEALEKGLLTALFLDTETTGLEVQFGEDEIIEVSMIQVFFDKEYKPIALGEEYNALQEPSKPLSEEIIGLTGLTDEMLKGQSIDFTKVKEMVSSASVCIAHNAKFDRGVFMKYLSLETLGKVWGCTFSDIDWRSKGFINSKQENLAIYHGFSYSGHRARVDVLALIIISLKSDYFKELLESSKGKKVMIKAYGSSIKTKNILSRASYRWNPNDKVWQKLVPSSELDNERKFLSNDIYRGSLGDAKFLEIPVKMNHASQEELDVYLSNQSPQQSIF